jgi:rhodanese-related sulfurtransferase
MTRTPDIDIDRFEAVQADATVIDVHEPVEYAAGHVPGARLVPMGQGSWTCATAPRSLTATPPAP